MQVNKEFFVSLSEQKQEIIENAFMEVKNEEISVQEFLERCAQVLTDYEFKSLFIMEEQQETYQEPEQRGRSTMIESPQINEYAQEEQNQQGKKQKKSEDNIDDIMQYTGVNLKEEAENIVKEIYNNYNESYSAVDLSSGGGSFDELFNIKAFSKYINNCCANRHVKITEDGVNVLFLLIYRKIMNLISKLDMASKTRTELNLSNYKYTVKNEHNKQMWYLNELEKLKFDTLNMQNDKEKRKKNIQEREDLVIKKRQSNSVAMAAMGIKQKSWMTSAERVEETSRFDSIYSPFDDKAFTGKNRIISHKDFLFVLERDKRYNKSIFLLMQYYK